MSGGTGSAGTGSGNDGRVWLVGAGPGDPGLITVRGLELLRRCDAVVFDRLVAPELVDEAPAEALRIGREPLAQEEINSLLVRLARRGLDVVRLKGGDPFLFGRGGEEALALVRGRAFRSRSCPACRRSRPSLRQPGSRSRTAAYRRR